MPLLQGQQISRQFSAGLRKCSFREKNVLSLGLLKKSWGLWAVMLVTLRMWITDFMETQLNPHSCAQPSFLQKKAPTIEKVYYHYFSCKDAKINPSNIIRQFFFFKKFFLNKENKKRKPLMGYLLFFSLFRFVNFWVTASTRDSL